MADEQESQHEAEVKNELPEGTAVEMTPVEEYQKENEQAKDKLAEFGFTDVEQFAAKVTSDSIFGKSIARKFLGLDGDKPFVNLEHKSSPQENNQTGQLDHATWPPKVKGGVDGATKDTASVTDAA